MLSIFSRGFLLYLGGGNNSMQYTHHIILLTFDQNVFLSTSPAQQPYDFSGNNSYLIGFSSFLHYIYILLILIILIFKEFFVIACVCVSVTLRVKEQKVKISFVTNYQAHSYTIKYNEKGKWVGVHGVPPHHKVSVEI